MTQSVETGLPDSGGIHDVQNLVTDCLDYIVAKNLDKVYLSAGERPIFDRGQRRIESPQFTDLVDEQDLSDCLEALFLDRQTSELGISFYHISETVDYAGFCVDIAPMSDGLDATIVRFRRIGIF
jgi:hypothetical protein